FVAGSAVAEPATNSPDSSPAAMSHTHPMLEVDPALPVPTVTLEAVKDEKDGYNLHLVTTNYTFTPEAANSPPAANTGHAHLYVNGQKVARVYGEWFHLPAADLAQGLNAVEVTLNANDHSEWVYEGAHLAATTTVQN
ncbi:hypothetical protein KC887_08875, partial [Candidatus Kaiserbacteria bacterium]|nr:hypothetical protein [Candidatus Kaiserbacteria bacterium]